MVLEAISEAWRERPDADPRTGREARRGRRAPARSVAAPDAGRRAPQRDHRHRRRARPRCSTATTAAGAARPKFPPHCTLEFLLAAGDRELAPATLRAMAAGGIYDQVGGGFSPLRGRRDLDRAALREDALRQRAAGPRLPARLAGDRRAALRRGLHARRSTGHCASCAGPRAASARHSMPTPRASRASSTSGPRSELRAALGPNSRRSARSPTSARPPTGNFEARHQRARGPRLGARAAARDPRRAARGAGRASPPRARRQAPDRLERADDHGARRRRRRARSARTTSRPRGVRELPARSSCATPTAGCCAPGRTGARRSPPTSRITPTCCRRCWSSTRRRFDERWYVEAVAIADTMIERFGDPEHGGFFTTAADVAAPGRPPQGPRGHADRVRATPRPRSGCCDSPGCPASPRTSAGRPACSRSTRRSPRATRSRSGSCCRRSTSTLRRRARWRSSAPARWPAPCAPATAPTSCSPAPTATPPTAPPSPLLRERTTVDGHQAAYVCERFACQLPVTGVEALEALLDR